MIHSIIEGITDGRGEQLVVLDLRSLEESTADYYVICEGESHTRVQGIADRVRQRVREEQGQRASHVEGEQARQWILIDYFDIVVHIFYPEARSFYDLEDLWSDALILDLASELSSAAALRT